MPSLLFANDAPGAYADSYYTASVTPDPPRACLKGTVRADVCVIGAGFTGLSAALHLAQAGLRVVVLDAQRAGWGASGRNGGQLGSGQRIEQPELEDMLGIDHARALWDISEAAKALVRDLAAHHDIACDLKPGVIHTNHRARYDREAAELVAHMNESYGTSLEYLAPDQCREIVRSPRYSAGVLDMSAGHLHPLKFALGLARAAEAAGAVIHENSPVTKVEDGATKQVKTAEGQVHADTVVLAGNGYLEGISDPVARHVMPINNFILATAPLTEAQRNSILTRDIAVADSKFVVNYYRFSADGRLLFGGRESYGYRFPKDLRSFVRKAMVDIYPQSADWRIDYGWGGTLAITMNRMPYLRQVAPGIWNGSGYSGHGVAMATMSGKILADAVAGEMTQFDAMAKVPARRFPGGPRLRQPLLMLAMLWYSLRDRL